MLQDNVFTDNVNDCDMQPTSCDKGVCFDAVNATYCVCNLGWMGKNCTEGNTTLSSFPFVLFYIFSVSFHKT